MYRMFKAVCTFDLILHFQSQWSIFVDFSVCDLIIIVTTVIIIFYVLLGRKRTYISNFFVFL